MSRLNPISTVRESKVITNQQTIANQVEIVAPGNARFKRTVYHTPAIIQTVVDTPETYIPAPQPIIQRSQFVSRQPVTRIDSNLHSRLRPQPSIVFPRNRVVQDRGVGVKVHEDLSGFRQTIVTENKMVKRQGCCARTVGLCWGNKCPFWVFILIPLLIVLFLLLLSSFVNKHRIFYGFDTSTANRSLSANNYANTQSIQNTTTTTVQKSDEIVNPIVSTDQTSLTPAQNTPSIVNSSERSVTNIEQPAQPGQPNYQGDSGYSGYPPAVNSTSQIERNQTLVSPETGISTDTRSTELKTTSNINSPDSLSSLSPNPAAPLSGDDIYSRVLARQQQQPARVTQTQYSTKTETNTDGLVNQAPGITEATKTVETETTNPGIRLAPTIEELRTRMMIDAERAGVKSHKRASYHLRHFVY